MPLRIVAPKGAGSSPVGHTLTQVAAQWTCVFCKGSENASRHLGEHRAQGQLRCYSVLSREAKEDHRVMASPPTGTVTFLFTDIEGSTKLWEHNAPAMQAALAHHDEILKGAIEEHAGYIFKTVGDAFCAAFSTARDALEAALESQRRLFSCEWEETGPLRVRMALHTGAVEERDTDYFGPPLNRVARLLAIGHGGQILLSQATYELVRDALPEGAGLRDLGEHQLKDLIRPERVYRLVGSDLPTDFPLLTSLNVR